MTWIKRTSPALPPVPPHQCAMPESEGVPVAGTQEISASIGYTRVKDANVGDLWECDTCAGLWEVVEGRYGDGDTRWAPARWSVRRRIRRERRAERDTTRRVPEGEEVNDKISTEEDQLDIASDEPIADWERELLEQQHRDHEQADAERAAWLPVVYASQIWWTSNGVRTTIAATGGSTTVQALIDQARKFRG